MNQQTKNVLIIYTGGTIGCQSFANGYAPVSGIIEKTLNHLKKNTQNLPQFKLLELSPLIDSANITPAHWHTIAQAIVDNYDAFDGFVILHGTDTMSYTASALSFILQNLNKPIIVTGSQIPIAEIRTDAHSNLIDAILLAANYNIPEVCLYFHDKLFRGNRSQKIDANGFDAFKSPNYPPLASLGTTIDIDWPLIQKANQQALSFQPLHEAHIASLYLYPGITEQIIENVLHKPTQAVVLLSYGQGNGPIQQKSLMQILAKAVASGMIVVNCTQCFRGSVNMDLYETGQYLKDIGILSGFDMTPEAALTKLHYLFSKQQSHEEIAQLVQTNLQGELTQ